MNLLHDVERSSIEQNVNKTRLVFVVN